VTKLEKFRRIQYGRQTIEEDDYESILKVLKSDFLTQGPTNELFEKKVANFCQSEYALSFNSATSALHVACLVLGLNKKDILWTSPISFVASANCGVYCGAKIDFVDIDPYTYNISVDALEEKLLIAEKIGTLPKILVVVHMAGQPARMSEIKALGDKYNFKIIEDASHALGSTYQNTNTGCCKYSDITVFSFHPVKIITTGEGGMMTTNLHDIYDKAKMLRSHGINKNPNNFLSESHGPWFYEQVNLGFNYRLSDINAALGISQLRKIKKFIKKRNELANNYAKLLNNEKIALPKVLENCYSSFHLYIINLKTHEMSISQTEVFKRLIEKGIMVNLHYIPIHLQPFYQRKFGFKLGDFPFAEKYYSCAVSLPIFPLMSKIDQEYIVNAVNTIVTRY